GRARCRPSWGWGPAGRGAHTNGVRAAGRRGAGPRRPRRAYKRSARCRPSWGWAPPAEAGINRGASVRGRTRRQPLKTAGPTAGALAIPRPAAAQAKPGTLISAQTTEATGLDPQLVPALSRSRRSPLTYNQLVRFDADMTAVPELAESWQISPDGLTW